MKVDITKLPKSEMELKIEVPAPEWQEFLNEAVKELSKELKIEGFRPGFAPFKIVEEKIGIAKILEEAAEHCVKKCYVKAILENKIEAIGQPEVSILKMSTATKDSLLVNEASNPFEFKVKVAVMPEVKLPDYKKIASVIERKKVSVAEKEVEETLSWIQKSRAKFSLKLGPCQKGDWIEIEYLSPQLENGKKVGDAFVLGEGHFISGFEKNLEGMIEGEEKEFFLVFPENHNIKELAGKEVEFKVKLKSVQKMELPEINDQFAQGLGNFPDLTALKKSLREGINLEKENEETQRIRQEILQKITQNSEIETPEILISREQNRMLEDLKQNITQKLGISTEDYLTKIKKTEKELLESFFPEAEKRIKNSLVLKEISKRENIKASAEETREEMQKMLIAYPKLKELDLNQLKDYTEEVLKNEKVFKFLESFTRKS